MLVEVLNMVAEVADRGQTGTLPLVLVGVRFKALVAEEAAAGWMRATLNVLVVLVVRVMLWFLAVAVRVELSTVSLAARGHPEPMGKAGMAEEAAAVKILAPLGLAGLAEHLAEVEGEAAPAQQLGALGVRVPAERYG